MKLDMHQHVIVMYIYIKIHEILFSHYLVMAPDGQTDGWKDVEKTDGRTDRWTWATQHPSTSVGGNNFDFFDRMLYLTVFFSRPKTLDSTKHYSNQMS